MKRIIAFLLALIISVGCTFGLTALANEADQSAPEATKPQIISQNVMYGGDFSLMFAVKAASVSGDTVTLSVYGEEPTESSEALWSKTINASSATTDVKGIASYVFTTPGVAAKDMDKNYYIVAESAGVKSEVKRYSVAEYLYERLYDDEIAFGTSDLEIAQAKLYNSVLQVGKNAQMLLFNYDNDPTNDRTTFVTDLYYVTLRSDNVFGVNGTLNGGKYTTYLMTADEIITLKAGTNGKYTSYAWKVDYYTDGVKTTSTVLGLSGIKPESHMIITPKSLALAPTVYDFESGSINSSVIKSLVLETTTVTLGQVNGSNAAQINLNGLTTKTYYETASYVMDTAAGSQKYVYEATVTPPSSPDELATDFYYYFRHKDYTYKLIFTKDAGSDHLVVSDNWSNATWKIDNATFDIRFEYFTAVIDGVERLVVDTYINGEYLVKSKTYSVALTAGTNDPATLATLRMVYSKNNPAGVVAYLDDVCSAMLAPVIDLE